MNDQLKRVLLVDDKSENLFFLDTLLSGNGFTVEQASNGKQALDLALESPPDMIISDVLMPVMDGFELCHKVKTNDRLKNAAFIFYTASYLDKRDEELALSLGVDRYLIKPQDPDILLKVFKEVFEEHETDSRTGVIPFPREGEYLKYHSESLVRMLEKKIEQLDKARLILEQEMDIRKKTEEELKASLLEKEILLKEVYHRTKNNMQVIIGLFDLQSRKMDDVNAISVFKAMSDRIFSMSYVHDLLFRSKNLHDLKLDRFLSKLAQQIVSINKTGETELELILNIDSILIDISIIIPLGLVINEILVNSIKHAFLDRSEGQIWINATLEGDQGLLLRIGDNGVGLTKEVNTFKAETLGLQIIRSIVENQLLGLLQIDSTNGLIYTITLPDLHLDD